MKLQQQEKQVVVSDYAAGVAAAILGVLAVSTSAVLIRLAGSVSPFEIAFWRLVTATLVLLPITFLTRGFVNIKQIGLKRLLLYGGALAAHFVAYNAALQFAPVAHVLPLLYTSTIMLAIFSAVLLRESLGSRQVVGIIVVLFGVAILAGFEPQFTWRTAVGDGLALASAAAYAAYSLIGRRERARLPLLGYATSVYGFAALWVFPFALLAAIRSGVALDRYDSQVVLALLALGLIPNAMGHTLYNASVRRLNPALTNVLFTQEITGGVILAWLILGEAASLNAVIGAAIMLVGLVLVLLR